MDKKFVTWRDEFSVGLDEIDDQHKTLIEMINELYDAFMKKEHREKIVDIVQKMAEYTLLHFSTEEKYFIKHRYSHSVEHVKQHKDFIEKVSEFQDALAKNHTTLTFKVITFLQKWLVNHILVEDKKYMGILAEAN